jgi:AcrR family transcriptional regulator
VGTSERRQREKERKAGEIISAAKELFFQKGYDSTSVDDVAAKVELSKGTIYLYFATKEELYYAVAKEGMSIVRDMFRDAASSTGNGLERLAKIGDAYIRFWTTQNEYRRLMNETKLAGSPLESGPNGKEFGAIAAESNNIMVQVVKEGMEDGSIRPDIDPVKFTFCTSSMIDGILARTERKGWGGRDGDFRQEMLSYAMWLLQDQVENPIKSKLKDKKK